MEDFKCLLSSAAGYPRPGYILHPYSSGIFSVKLISLLQGGASYLIKTDNNIKFKQIIDVTIGYYFKFYVSQKGMSFKNSREPDGRNVIFKSKSICYFGYNM